MRIAAAVLPFLLCLLIQSCGENMPEDEVMQIGLVPCQQQPKFIAQIGFNSSRTAFSTSEKGKEGLVLVQFGATAADTAGRRTWQHPSWKQFGSLGPITTDDAGNAYTAPIPVINVLNNQADKQNIIYRVDHNSGEMKALAGLPRGGALTEGNPYGPCGI